MLCTHHFFLVLQDAHLVLQLKALCGDFDIERLGGLARLFRESLVSVTQSVNNHETSNCITYLAMVSCSAASSRALRATVSAYSVRLALQTRTKVTD